MKNFRRVLSLLVVLSMAMSISAFAATDLNSLKTELSDGNAKLEASFDVTEQVVISKDATLDLNGYTLTGTADAEMIKVTDGTLTVQDNSEAGGGKITTNLPGAVLLDGGSLKQEGGEISASFTTYSYFDSRNYQKNVLDGAKAIVNNGDGNIEITGGSVIAKGYRDSKGTSKDPVAAIYATEKSTGTITVSGEGTTVTAWRDPSKQDQYAFAIMTEGTGDVVVKDGAQLTATGRFNAGAIAATGSADINVSDSTLTVSDSDGAYGIWNEGSGNITVENANIDVQISKTNANEAYAILNGTDGGTVTVSGDKTEITVSGNMLVYGIENAGGKVTVEDAAIDVKTTGGYGAYGINNIGSGAVELTNATVNAESKTSTAVAVNNTGDGDVTVEGGAVTAVSTRDTEYEPTTAIKNTNQENKVTVQGGAEVTSTVGDKKDSGAAAITSANSDNVEIIEESSTSAESGTEQGGETFDVVFVGVDSAEEDIAEEETPLAALPEAAADLTLEDAVALAVEYEVVTEDTEALTCAELIETLYRLAEASGLDVSGYEAAIEWAISIGLITEADVLTDVLTQEQLTAIMQLFYALFVEA